MADAKRTIEILLQFKQTGQEVVQQLAGTLKDLANPVNQTKAAFDGFANAGIKALSGVNAKLEGFRKELASGELAVKVFSGVATASFRSVEAAAEAVWGAITGGISTLLKFLNPFTWEGLVTGAALGGAGLVTKGWIESADAAQRYRQALGGVVGDQKIANRLWEEFEDRSEKIGISAEAQAKIFTRLAELRVKDPEAATKTLVGVAAYKQIDPEELLSRVSNPNPRGLKQFGIDMNTLGQQVELTSGNIRSTVANTEESIRQGLLDLLDVKFKGALDRAQGNFSVTMASFRQIIARYGEDFGAILLPPVKKAIDQLNTWLRDNRETIVATIQALPALATATLAFFDKMLETGKTTETLNPIISSMLDLVATMMVAVTDLVLAAIKLLAVPVTAITDDKATASLTFKETAGAMTLDPILVPGTVPEGVTVYQSLPVMPDFSNWGSGGGAGGSGITAGVKRMAEVTRVGLTTYTETHGSRFKRVQKVDALSLDRAAAWAVAGWFDALGGQQKVGLAVSPSSDFELASVPDTAHRLVLAVKAVGASLEWGWRTHLAIVLADGTTIVRGIVSTARASGVDTVTFADPWPDELYAEGAAILRISEAFKGRQDSDELVETWRTDRVMSTQLGMVEALEEKSIDLANVVDPLTGETARAASYSCCGSSVCAICAPDFWLRWRLANGTIRTVKVSHIVGTCQWKNEAEDVVVEKLTGIYWQITAGSFHWVSTVIASCPPVGYKSWAADTGTTDLGWFEKTAPATLFCLHTWASAYRWTNCTHDPVVLQSVQLFVAAEITGPLDSWFIQGPAACTVLLRYQRKIAATQSGVSTDHIDSCNPETPPTLTSLTPPSACAADASFSTLTLDVGGLTLAGGTTGYSGPPMPLNGPGLSTRVGSSVTLTKVTGKIYSGTFNILLADSDGDFTALTATLTGVDCTGPFTGNPQHEDGRPYPSWWIGFVADESVGTGKHAGISPAGIYGMWSGFVSESGQPPRLSGSAGVS